MREAALAGRRHDNLPMKHTLARPHTIAFALLMLIAGHAASACCIGIYYALDPDTAQSMRTLPEAERLTRINSLLASTTGADKLDVDESWDAMHRALTNGKLDFGPGKYATSFVVLGGERLFSGDEWIVMLISAAQAKAAATEIQPISRDAFHLRYGVIDGSYDRVPSEEDFEYTWTSFIEVKSAFARWAREGKWILFVAAQ